MNVSASKSISAPADIILKCDVPLGAEIMFAGTNDAMSTVISPVILSIAPTKGANKLVPSFPRMLNSKPFNNSASPSITLRSPRKLVVSA